MINNTAYKELLDKAARFRITGFNQLPKEIMPYAASIYMESLDEFEFSEIMESLTWDLRCPILQMLFNRTKIGDLSFLKECKKQLYDQINYYTSDDFEEANDEFRREVGDGRLNDYDPMQDPSVRDTIVKDWIEYLDQLFIHTEHLK